MKTLLIPFLMVAATLTAHAHCGGCASDKKATDKAAQCDKADKSCDKAAKAECDKAAKACDKAAKAECDKAAK